MVLHLKVVLKWIMWIGGRIYVEYLRVASLMAGFKMGENLKWMGHKSQEALYLGSRERTSSFFGFRKKKC